MSCINDNSIGPTVRGCRDDFDFTVYFEHVVLSIIPSCFFIVLSLVNISHFIYKPKIVNGRYLQLFKQILACAFLVIKTALLALSVKAWSHDSINQTIAITSASLEVVTGLAIVPLSWLSHTRSARPSILITSYLLLTLTFDIVTVRTAWLVDLGRTNTQYCRLVTAAAALKASLLVAESYGKSKWLTWDRKNVSPEETSGIYSLGAFGWLNGLFLQGYKGLLTLKSLYPLDEALVTKIAGQKFLEFLKKHPMNEVKFSLVYKILRSLTAPLLLPIIPRLILLASNFCQPFVIESLLEFLQNKHQDKNHGYGLIISTLLTYGTIAVSTALYWYLQQRATIGMRTSLVYAVYDKTTRIKLSQAEDADALTIMSTDVETAMEGLEYVHEYWANIIQALVAAWLLYTRIGAVFAATIVVVLLCAAASSLLGRMIFSRQNAWMEAIQRRVGVTAGAISHMKLIKMAGMAKPVRRTIQSLRDNEIKLGGRWRAMIASVAVISQVPLTISPAATFLVASGNLSTTQIFVSLSYITLLASPLNQMLQSFSELISAFACLQRIQRYLEKEERIDYRHFEESPKTSLMTIEGGAVEMQNLRKEEELPAIKLSDVSFGWVKDRPVLKEANVTIAPSQLTVVVGPVASGKSTFCKGLLGEAEFSQGLVSVSSGARIAYCDQQPFLSNSSIRSNILGHLPFSASRYEQVIQATMLYEDFKTLPRGDQTVIGSGGIALSGGQRQRVSIARALYLTSANILIFDDVLSGLDVSTEEHLFNHIFAPGGLLRQNGIATLLCTHNMRHVAYADRIITIDNGTVQEKEQDVSTVLKKESQKSNTSPNAPPSVALPDNIPSTPSSTADDHARQMGDSSVYKVYFKTISWPAHLVFWGVAILYGFFNNFPRVWLSFWSNDISRDEGPSHTQAYYTGIYAFLQIMSIVSFAVSGFTILLVMIRQSGTAFHHQAAQTVVKAPLRFFTTTDIGVVTNYFSQDLNLIDTKLPIALVNVAFGITGVIGMGAVLASSSPWLALSFPGLLGILWMLLKFYLRTSRQLRLIDLEAKSPLYSHFLDTAKGIATVRAFGWIEDSLELHQSRLDDSQKAMYLFLMIQRWLHFALNMVVTVIATCLVALMTQLSASAGLSGASLVTLMTLSSVLMSIVRWYAEMETSIGAVARLTSFSAKTPVEGPHHTEKPTSSWPAHGAIDMKGVWASYTDSDKEYALRGLAMEVQPGEKVAICGRTGSGKSSTILVLLGLLDPMDTDNGSSMLSIDGVPLNSVDREELRERLITVPQDPVFLPAGGTVAQNLDPLDEATPDQCEAVLRDVGLWHVAETAGGLNAELNESTLSQGQRQLFNLGRAVLKRRISHRSVLLLDEFTASVDAETERDMLKLVDREFKGCTVLMISHRLDMVLELFDRVVVMDKGSLVESGDPRMLRDVPDGRFASLVEAAKIAAPTS